MAAGPATAQPFWEAGEGLGKADLGETQWSDRRRGDEPTSGEGRGQGVGRGRGTGGERGGSFTK